jgi:HEAT repeats
MGLLRKDDDRRYVPGTNREPYRSSPRSQRAVRPLARNPLEAIGDYGSAPTYLSVEDEPGDASSLPQSEAAAFRLHLDTHPTLTPPSAAASDSPDPAPTLEHIEQELGIPALAASIAEYGTPPTAPQAERCDRDALEREMLDEALDGIPRWDLVARRSLRGRASEEAGRQAQAENERYADEQRGWQDELDARWAELGALRERAEQHLVEWIDEETRRSEREQLEVQAALDAEWGELIDAQPRSVTAVLRDGIPDSTATVLGYLDGIAVLTVSSPPTTVIADTEAVLHGAGDPTVRTRSVKHRNHLYLSAIASRVLAGVGHALAATPAVRAVACIAVRAGDPGDPPSEALYLGTFSRAYVERLVAEGRWSADPGMLAKALEDAEEVRLDVASRTREVSPLNLTERHGLVAVMNQLDPAIRADENAARASDEEAVKIFLAGHIERDDSTQADVSLDPPLPADAPTEPRSEAESPADASAQTPFADDLPSGRDAVWPDPPAGERFEDAEALDSSGRQREVGSDDGSFVNDGYPLRDGDEPPLIAPAHEGHDDPLIAALSDRDAFVRRAAVEAIHNRQDPSDTPLLLDILRDLDDSVRLEALYALKDRLAPDTRRAAVVKACGHSDEAVRREAIGALAEFADERDTPLLLDALRDYDSGVRLEAIFAVKHRLSPEMRDALIDACADTDENVRRKAFEAIVELDDERDLPVLLKALKDSDSSVRLEAIYALGRRSSPGSWNGLSELLSEAMRDEDARARQAAVALFGRLQQREQGQGGRSPEESDSPA